MFLVILKDRQEKNHKNIYSNTTLCRYVETFAVFVLVHDELHILLLVIRNMCKKL